MKTLSQIYEETAKDNYIEPSLYKENHVKQGLRNENGTGVKVGLTRICDVRGYRMEGEEKIATEGHLIYLSLIHI